MPEETGQDQEKDWDVVPIPQDERSLDSYEPKITEMTNILKIEGSEEN